MSKHWLQPLSQGSKGGQSGSGSAGPTGEQGKELAVQAFLMGLLSIKSSNPS